jgi:hypothetical protein
MKYIKQFEINFNRPSNLSEEDKDFYDVRDIIDNYIENNDLCRSFSSGRYYKADYKKDIEDFKLYLKGVDINFDIFIKRHWNRVFSDDFFVENNGFLDSLLYQYNQAYPIGGRYELDQLEQGNPACEHIMKYDYGYHKFDLGRKYILQSYETIADYFFACAQLLGKELFDSDYSNLLNSKWENIVNYNFSVNSEKFMTPVKLDRGGSVCFINLLKMHELGSLVEYNRFFNTFIDLVKPSASNKDEGWCIYYFGENEKLKKSLSNISLEDITNSDVEQIKKEIRFKTDVINYNL